MQTEWRSPREACRIGWSSDSVAHLRVILPSLLSKVDTFRIREDARDIPLGRPDIIFYIALPLETVHLLASLYGQGAAAGIAKRSKPPLVHYIIHLIGRSRYSFW